MILQRIDKILAGLPENARLRSELDELRKEMTLLEEENSVLKSKVSDLQSKLDAIEENKEIDNQAYKILEALFEERDGLSAADVASRFQISEGVVMSHFDTLDGHGFAVTHPVVCSVGRPDSVSADISQEGRAYVMAARKRVQ
jgi:response regulator of citrate/malate metabolism